MKILRNNDFQDYNFCLLTCLQCWCASKYPKWMKIFLCWDEATQSYNLGLDPGPINYFIIIYYFIILFLFYRRQYNPGLCFFFSFFFFCNILLHNSNNRKSLCLKYYYPFLRDNSARSFNSKRHPFSMTSNWKNSHFILYFLPEIFMCTFTPPTLQSHFQPLHTIWKMNTSAKKFVKV